MPRWVSELSLPHCPVHPCGYEVRISPLPWGLRRTLHNFQETWQLLWPCSNTKQVTRSSEPSQDRPQGFTKQVLLCGSLPCKRWLFKTWLHDNFTTANYSTPLLLTSWIICFTETVPVPYANASNRDVGVLEPLQLLHCLVEDSRVWEGGRSGAAPCTLLTSSQLIADLGSLSPPPPPRQFLCKHLEEVGRKKGTKQET